MIHETGARVTVTWPAAHTPPTALPVFGIAFDDPDTGERLTDVTAMRMDLDAGGDSVIEVVLTRLVDADGQPIGSGDGSDQRITMTDEYAAYRREHALDEPHPADEFPTDEFAGPKFRSAQFRYVVAQMRVAQAQQ